MRGYNERTEKNTYLNEKEYISNMNILMCYGGNYENL